MAVNRFYLMALIGIVFILGYLNYRILEPFLIPIAWAMVLSVLFYPVYAFVLKYVRSRSVASFLTLSVILLVIIGPFSYLSFLLMKELGALLDSEGVKKLTGFSDEALFLLKCGHRPHGSRILCLKNA